MNWTNIWERTLWTALEAAFAAIPVAQVAAAIAGGDLTALQQLGLSTLSAFVGAAIAALKTIAQERLKALNNPDA